MSLYTLTTGEAAWRIRKFDEDLNLESEYDVDEGMCTCPQAAKPTCRHRQMFTEFFTRDHVDDGWLLEFDADGDHTWHEPPPAIREAVEQARLNRFQDTGTLNLPFPTPPTMEAPMSNAPTADTISTQQPATSLSAGSPQEGGVISTASPTTGVRIRRRF